MQHPLSEMRTEWNGLRVHKSEWEPKHPQLTPRFVEDGIMLDDPRPGAHSREDAAVLLRFGTHMLATAQFDRPNQEIYTWPEAPTTLTMTASLGDAWPYVDRVGITAPSAMTSGVGTVALTLTEELAHTTMTAGVGVAVADVFHGWSHSTWNHTKGWGV